MAINFIDFGKKPPKTPEVSGEVTADSESSLDTEKLTEEEIKKLTEKALKEEENRIELKLKNQEAGRQNDLEYITTEVLNRIATLYGDGGEVLRYEIRHNPELYYIGEHVISPEKKELLPGSDSAGKKTDEIAMLMRAMRECIADSNEKHMEDNYRPDGKPKRTVD